jgi:hypothetical protein
MGWRAERDTAIAVAAADQYGLITGAQLTGVGVTRDGIRGRVDSGVLIRVSRGLFRVSSAPVTWEQRALAMLLVNGSEVVLSHFAAARLLGFDIGSPKRIDVTVGLRREGVALGTARVHRTRSLPSCDIKQTGLFRVTSEARTLADLAAVMDFSRLTAVVDDAIVRGQCSVRDLTALLVRADMRTRKGTNGLRAIVDAWLGSSTPKSVAEASMLRVLDRAGIPPPICQYEVHLGPGQVVFLDFAWPDDKVAAEMDGFRWHGSPSAAARDSVRANRLLALGWTIVRTTPKALAESPDSLLKPLRARLGR